MAGMRSDLRTKNPHITKSIILEPKEYFKKRIPILLELGVRQEALKPLENYIRLLWTTNAELNLISRTMTFEELIDNHLIDCLLPLSYFPSQVKQVADFGTGGGLPGVVLAVQFPGIQFHLFEKSKKKQEFLRRCKEIAPNLKIHGEIPPELEGIDLVTARAFKPMDVLLEMSRKYFERGGKYFLLKARREKIEEELVLSKKKFKNLSIRIEPLKSPVLDVERHLVLI
jgi:16S rRNA (guanine527-N7)-methyltransferase